MCTFPDDFQIEREKADLSVQVISLSERLEESEGGVESHVKKKNSHFLRSIWNNHKILVGSYP